MVNSEQSTQPQFQATRRTRTYLLWADIDENPSLDAIQIALIKIIGQGSEYEIFASRSATQANQKCRILIPLDQPLYGVDWLLYQQILNDKLEARGIIPDRVNQRSAQLCYLPNRGEFYDSRSYRNV